MIFTDERVFMNTIIRIQVVSDKGTVFTRELIAKAFECFDEVVEKYSRFNRQSELSALNAAAGSAHSVSENLFGMVAQALEVAEITDGAYDPTVIDLLEAYGYDAKADFSRLDQPELYAEIQNLSKNRPSFREIELNRAKKTIKLAPKQRLDLGSVGKGFAIDLAYNVLDGNDFDGFLINAGGDVRAYGCNKEGLPWKLLLYRSQLPNSRLTQDNCLGVIPLINKSLAGSGGWARRVGSFHHLLNPKDGLPINTVSQTYVIANTATESDIWATALFCRGKALLPELEKRQMAGLIIESTGSVFSSPDFEYDI